MKENKGVERSGGLIPFQGSFQLTFLNHLQADRDTLFNLFSKHGDVLQGSKIYSLMKRRCYIHYATQDEALTALKELTGCAVVQDLSIAKDCIRHNKRRQTSADTATADTEEPDMVASLGTYDLTYTTDRDFNIPDIRARFAEFGTVGSVVAGSRIIKGRTRVFVKFNEYFGALEALSSLKSSLPDLAVAKSCRPSERSDNALCPDNNGFYCVRFKNCDTSGRHILQRAEVIELFNQFGAVMSVYGDRLRWCYVRFKQEEEAKLAVSELSLAGQLPGIDFASSRRDTNQLVKKRIRDAPDESANELLISNYPHSTSAARLTSFFSEISSFKIREMITDGRKAYAFARCDTKDELERAVATYHNTRLGNRQVRVVAKLPQVQAEIQAELDRKQSCTMRLPATDLDPHELFSHTSSDSDSDVDDELLSSVDQLTVEDVARSPDVCNVVLANFGPATTEKDIAILLSAFQVVWIRLKEQAPVSTDEFSYAIVGFASRQQADLAIDQLDGSVNLFSENIVLQLAD